MDRTFEGTVAVSPVVAERRLDSLDFLRGVALMGILLVNINSFAMPGTSYAHPYIWGELSALDRIVFGLNYTFVQQKFYSIFSILFGAGLFLQTARLDHGGARTWAIFLRRIAVLFLFGITHAVFFWMGDILNWYAMAALIVFLMRGFSSRVLLWMAAGFAVLPTLLCVLPMGFLGQLNAGDHVYTLYPATFEAGMPYIDAGFTKQFTLLFEQSATSASMEAAVYRYGSWADVTSLRLAHLLMMLVVFAFVMSWPIIAYMLLGVAMMKGGVFANPRRFAERLGRAWVVLAVVGGLLTLWGLPLLFSPAGWRPFASSLLLGFGAYGMTAGYLVILFRLCSGADFHRWSHPIRQFGRMALTNYLTQSIVMTLFFYGYGFGQFGRWSYSSLIPLVIGMWILQIALSVWWLRHFHYGPIEWLWRCATYLRLFPIRRTQSVHA